MDKHTSSSGAERVPILLAGKWEQSRAARSGDLFNPSTGAVTGAAPFCDADEVDRAVRAAADALPEWGKTPIVERARVLFRFRERVEAAAEELARIVTRENGKTLSESRASVQRGIEMIEFACGAPSLVMGQCVENIARDVDCETMRHPVGVCAGITPFNFPVMVPLWMFSPAIVCGNTFVLKPSEKTPRSVIRLGELLAEAGLPPGVFNIVHGDRECVDALITHPLVRAVSFVGSTAVAKHVYETGARHGKRVQAAGGAKNHMIIMPDADLDQSVAALAASGYGCAGERCMAGSVALAVGDIGDRLVERLCERAAGMKVGPTDGGANVDMGPLITRAHLDRVRGYLDVAADEGAKVALDGREAARDGGGFLLGPCVIDQVAPMMRVAREEIFGPVLSVVRARDLDEALSIGSTSEYGNGASIFTRSGWAARQFKHRSNAGMIGINVGVPAPMAWFPFTGWNSSFFGDLHLQGTEGVQFYTRQKMTMTRWFETARDAHHDPIWTSAGVAREPRRGVGT
jgi:malonate-semialdehyde dehydrogenase (acetylating)/methylmalonate-semialdehyde dehydrogenase